MRSWVWNLLEPGVFFSLSISNFFNLKYFQWYAYDHSSKQRFSIKNHRLLSFFHSRCFFFHSKSDPNLDWSEIPPTEKKNFLIFFGQKNLRAVQVRASKYFFHWNCCCPKVTRPGFAQNHFKFKACWVFFWPAQVHKLSKREGLNFLLNPLKLYECFDALNCHHVRPHRWSF